MAHFAQIDENSIVINVIVVSNDDCLDFDGSESKLGIAFCKNLLGADTNWVRTSYNNNIRCRYASVGMKYDSTNDVFYYPVPLYPSWVLNTSTWDWDAPVALPDDTGEDDADNPTEFVGYDWDEDSTSWTNRTVTDLTNLPPEWR
jgi:hypothetical protein|tara:strand:+ start:78 stop:512 length:435 start_codon:yes stop_codon:yes gene_type:complete